MSWEHPIVLAFIPLALGVVWWMFRRPRSAHTTAHYVNIRRLWADRHGLADRPAATRRRWAGWLMALGTVGVLLALARPQWGTIEETSYEHAREVLLALDLSRSMLADDVAPTRLARAKLLIESLLDQLRGERVGLVVFAGTAFVQSPLSADYEVLRDFLNDLDPSYLPQGGTNYEAMLNAATKAFGQTGDGDRFLVVLSDGEAHDDGWKSLIPALRQHGIRVIGLGVGTAQGALLPNGTGGFLKDEQGAAVLSRLEPATLQELAKETGGTYRDAATWVDIAELVNATVEQGRKGNYVEQKNVRLRDQYQWFLAPAVLCWLLSYWLEFPIFRAARALPRRRPNQQPSAAAAIAAAVLAVWAWQVSRAAAATGAKPSSLESTVSDLAAKPLLAGDDYARLANETIAFAAQPNAANDNSGTGVIDDALTAVDRGEALDPKAADWPALRHQLQQLKEAKKEPPKPKERPPQQGQQENQQNQDGSNHDRSQNQSGGQPQPRQQGQQAAQQPSASQQSNQTGGQSPDQHAQPQSGDGQADQHGMPPHEGAKDAHNNASGGPDDHQNGQPRKEAQEGKQEQSAGGGKDKKNQEDRRGTEPANAKAQEPRPDDRQHEATTAAGEVQRGDTKPVDAAEASLGNKEGQDSPPAAGKESHDAKPPTRLVGGGRALQGAPPQGNPVLADALGRMEHVKDGDAPAVLFDRMNQADNPRPQQQSGKNW